MNTNPIQRLIDLGLPVGWRTLFVGRAGPADFLVDEQVLLDEKVVIEFAMDQVSNGSDDKRVIELAGSLPMERDYIWKTLASLAEDERGTDFETERRKWRVLLLRELLERLPDKFVDGLSELTSFWAGFGYPADGPHTVQGRGNSIPPRDYYTEQNFRELKKKHRQWIKAELADLRWTGRTNAPQDFIGSNGNSFDITGGSFSSAREHFLRTGVDSVITYESIPDDLGYRFIKWLDDQ